jgi:anti-sigma regulatory factor (Ser/Thr protein kinase)
LPTVPFALASLPVDARAPAAARALLTGLLPGEPGEVEATAYLLVSELASNVVRHAGLDEHDTLSVSAESDHRRLRVSVCSEGTGFGPEVRRTPDQMEGGWGLFLVDRMADRWGISGGERTCVWFELGFRPG